jgi:hypothetical protein
VTPPVIQDDFAEHCRTCARDLQESLRSLYLELGADSTRPQEVSRQFKLNKNLTWKIAKVLATIDPIDAVTLIPGSEGMEILLAAMSAAGARPDSVGAVRARLAAFEHMVEAHVGDRATLELLMDGMSRGGKALEVSRKLAFRGNSGVWGLQARVRSRTQFLAPNEARPDLLDLASVGGLHDIRRLRPLQGWPLFRFTNYGTRIVDPSQRRNITPIEPPSRPEDPQLIMRSFCDPPGAEVRSIEIGDDVSHELMDGPIGRRGEVTFVFGGIERAVVPRYTSKREKPPEHGELGALVTMPTEHVLLDTLVHVDMLDDFVPELAVYGRPFGNLVVEDVTRENFRLPIDEPIVRINPAIGSLSSELLPDQRRLIQFVLDRAGWSAKDFVCFRAVVPYPPMPSTVMMRYRLPLAPGA